MKQQLLEESGSNKKAAVRQVAEKLRRELSKGEKLEKTFLVGNHEQALEGRDEDILSSESRTAEDRPAQRQPWDAELNNIIQSIQDECNIIFEAKKHTPVPVVHGTNYSPRTVMVTLSDKKGAKTDVQPIRRSSSISDPPATNSDIDRVLDETEALVWSLVGKI